MTYNYSYLVGFPGAWLMVSRTRCYAWPIDGRRECDHNIDPLRRRRRPLLPRCFRLILCSTYELWEINDAVNLGVSARSAHWYAAALTNSSKDLKFFDNRSPRNFLAKVTAIDKQTPDQQKYIRAEAANANDVEAIPLFGLAIVAGNMARLPAETMNRFVFTWYVPQEQRRLGLRALYNVLYIGTNGHKLSFLRSATYLGAILSTFNIFIKAGRVLNGGI
ncbi:BQ2448_7616 [Microbotryum intermedium]|uniref:BQ2448_7616 protein n=1 Tax=Microbotryum intermedium TaxID=269621 RepID=A0A238FMT0_9BASI|nr:BQ2448_7616 [Microbotryum intermedium]